MGTGYGGDMQQRGQQQHQSQRIFTASEVAEFEYCPLTWWHQQFEPLAQADTEEIFARLVELEDEHGPQAPTLPEYQVGEQLLLRRGAFEEGIQQHQEHADEVAEIEEERVNVTGSGDSARTLGRIALVVLLLALLLIAVSILLTFVAR
ncbi:MAG: hypothetical protein JO011_00045 [Ktedonobacteraceae bacterium]|nr:hypothetical protein [Ktedonobacteraceae bacterium]